MKSKIKAGKWVRWNNYEVCPLYEMTPVTPGRKGGWICEVRTRNGDVEAQGYHWERMFDKGSPERAFFERFTKNKFKDGLGDYFYRRYIYAESESLEHAFAVSYSKTELSATDFLSLW